MKPIAVAAKIHFFLTFSQAERYTLHIIALLLHLNLVLLGPYTIKVRRVPQM